MAGKLSASEQEAFGVDSYYDRATTKTKANSTLFIAFRDATVQTPANERAAVCEQLFTDSPGYIGVRQVRGMCFIDFEDVKSATCAMMRRRTPQGREPCSSFGAALTACADSSRPSALSSARQRGTTALPSTTIRIRALLASGSVSARRLHNAM